MPEDQKVAGIRCMEVLAVLDDYVDGQVSNELKAQIEAHLQGCAWCTEFGGRYAHTVMQLRSKLAAKPTPSLDPMSLWKTRHPS